MFWTRLFSGIILVIIAAASIAAGSAGTLYGAAGGFHYRYERALPGHGRPSEGIRSSGDRRIHWRSGILSYPFVGTERRGFSGDPALCAGITYVCLCIYLSQISGRTDHGCHVWDPLCGGDAVLYIQDQKSGRRRLAGGADLLKLLGQRYLCLLRRTPL